MILDGGHKKGAAWIAKKTEGEVKFGAGTLADAPIPEIVERDAVASERWREVVEIYSGSGVGIGSSCDAGILEQYCVVYSQYRSLSRDATTLDNERIQYESKENCGPGTLWQKMTDFDFERYIKLHSALDRKLKLLVTIEDRLYLTPMSRAKQAAKAKSDEEKKDPLTEAGFGVV